MKLNKLLKLIDIESDLAINVTGITEDSRLVETGNIFIDWTNRKEYIKEAKEKGAIYIIDALAIPNFDQKLLILLDAFYPLPSKMKFVGITGTNGKTTSAHFLYQLLTSLGRKAMVVGTIGVKMTNQEYAIRGTTPSVLTLYRLVDLAKKHDIEFFIFEVSSHSLVLNRLGNIRLDYSIFLNLGRDHLDFHGSDEEYLKAKTKIINYLKVDGLSIVNGDDPKSQFFLTDKTFFFGINNSYLPISDINESMAATTFKIGEISFSLPAPGRYNLYNLMPALFILMAEGFPLQAIADGVQTIKLPEGRLEKISSRPLVYRDFAHTQAAVQAVLKTIRAVSNYKICSIIGCGGDRDRGKRAEIGATASELSDIVIVTSDNPRHEEPLQIIIDIVRGIKSENYLVIADRHQAINAAIKSYSDYLIILFGKGHEKTQTIGNEEIEFDERRIVNETIAAIYQDN